jgi:dienelactone hydrolase
MEEIGMKILSLFLVLVFSFLTISASAKIVGKEVEYKSDGTTLKGYLAYDNSVKGKRPGVLVVHEWWGHNDYARTRANKLAELGYTAFAVDMYGNAEQADHPKKAGELATAVLSNLDVAEARFTAAMDYLKKQKTVNPEQIAAIGYCFGGGVVLNMALRGVDIDGVASFHGLLPQEAPENAKPTADIIVFHGGDDPFVSKEQFDVFKKIMQDTGANYELVVYPGVQHSFTNPDAGKYGKKFDLPLVYNEDADKKSWEQTQAFLNRIFQPENN